MAELNVPTTLKDFLQNCRALRSRGLLLIQGEDDASRDAANRLCSNLAEVLRYQPDEPSTSLGRIIGCEFDSIILDVRLGLDPEWFAAAAGTIRAGGQMLLLVPDEQVWCELPDLSMQRYTPYPFPENYWHNNFVRRFIRLYKAGTHSNTVKLVRPTDINSEQIEVSSAIPFSPTEEQKLAVSGILKVMNGKRRRPLVLVSDRGRGKSAALGIGAAKIMSTCQADIAVIASSRAAVQTLFNHASRYLGVEATTENTLAWQHSKLRYSSIDQVTKTEPVPDLVMADEAASFSLTELQRLQEVCGRVVFSTTIHGYEGSGRGFALRFDQLLRQNSRGLHYTELAKPVRYAENDFLEQFCFDCLLLDAEPVSAPDDAESIQTEWLDKSVLCNDEGVLEQVFGLLVQAHYRTSPNDLRQLLDNPDLELLVVKAGEGIVGVLLIQHEGQLDRDMAEQVWQGLRRPGGHLIAECLAIHGGLRDAPTWKGARVMRIVVHPDMRGRGLGSLLLQVARKQLNGFDYLGTSFSLGPGLLEFWQANGFSTLRIGRRSQTASGAPSALMIQGLSPGTRNSLDRVAELFHRSLLLELPGRLLNLDSYELIPLFHEAKYQNQFNESDRQQLAVELLRFVDGGCAPESIWPVVYDASRLLIADRNTDLKDGVFLLDYVLKSRQDLPRGERNRRLKQIFSGFE